MLCIYWLSSTALWRLALDEGLIHDQSDRLETALVSISGTLTWMWRWVSCGAACRCPEIALGDMEKYLPLSKIFRIPGKSPLALNPSGDTCSGFIKFSSV